MVDDRQAAQHPVPFQSAHAPATFTNGSMRLSLLSDLNLFITYLGTPN